jgi:hypothetical protein
MERKDIVARDGIKYTLTSLNSYGYSIGFRQWKKQYDKDHFIIKTVGRKFDKSLFSFPHTPIVIDDIANIGKFSRKSNLRVLDMPIKLAGFSDYRIPRELDQFDELIAKCVSFEREINPFIHEYYAYLTVDQGTIQKDEYQRRPGCHTDGFQGAGIQWKVPVARSYIVYDECPPVFFPQSFKTDHLDEAKHNFFMSFDEQADENMSLIFDPYQIVLMNGYTVHRASKMEDTRYRTFFRLTFDFNIYNRFGNTHNPMFHYKWNMIEKDTQRNLIHKPLPIQPMKQWRPPMRHPDAY